MKRIGVLGLILLSPAANLVTPVFGCGDKFLISSRGTRYQRAPIARQAAGILIYSDPAMSQALAGVPVDATLRNAGYQPTIVESSAELGRALVKGGWDLVVVALSDVQALGQGQKSFGVLPVAMNLGPADLKAARKTFPVVLKAPAKSQTLLEAVDSALANRPKSQQKTSKGAA